VQLGEVRPLSVRRDETDGSFLYSFEKNFVGTIEFAPLPFAENGSNLTVILLHTLAGGCE
jgi:hypothetical protein